MQKNKGIFFVDLRNPSAGVLIITSYRIKCKKNHIKILPCGNDRMRKKR